MLNLVEINERICWSIWFGRELIKFIFLIEFFFLVIIIYGIIYFYFFKYILL